MAVFGLKMKMLVKTQITILLLSLLAVPGSTFSFSRTIKVNESRWIGTTDYPGFKVHVEASLCQEKSKIRSGELSFFADAALSFDVKLPAKLEIGNVRSEGDSLIIEFNSGNVKFQGVRSGGVISGKLIAGSRQHSLRLYALDDHSADLKKYPGIYELNGDTLMVTPREYGGLRMVNLNTGQSRTLIQVRKGHFTSRKALLKHDEPVVEFRFPKKRSKLIGMLQTLGERHHFARCLDGPRQQELIFDAQGIRLKGTLFTPPGKGPYHTILLVHGAGPIYRTALVEAAYRFTEMGYAAFIYDKRGTGASGGERGMDEYEPLAGDAAMIMKQLREHRQVKTVGYQGHSQAGWVIPLAVTKGASPDFVIIANGGSVKDGAQTLFDKRNDFERAGYNSEEAENGMSILKHVHNYVRDTTGDHQLLEVDFLEAQEKPWFDLLGLPRFPQFPSWDNPPKEMIQFAEKLRYDPVKTQAEMKHIPVLVLLGEQDVTVPAVEVAEGWRRSGLSHLTIKVFPDLGHSMKRATESGGHVLAKDFLNAQKIWLGSILKEH